MTDAIDVIGVVVNRPIRVMLEMIVKSRLRKLFGRGNVVRHFVLPLLPGSDPAAWSAPSSFGRSRAALLLPAARYRPAVDKADQLPSPAQRWLWVAPVGPSPFRE